MTSSSRPSRFSRLRVGVDVMNVAEVRAAIARFGDRYITRTFTDAEAGYCRQAVPAVAAARFAVRFAAKEAVVKALRPTGRWSDWRAIEIRRQANGCCDVRLHREAAVLARRRRIAHLALSMSHDGDCAAAVVIAVPIPIRPWRDPHAP